MNMRAAASIIEVGSVVEGLVAIEECHAKAKE